MSIVAMMPGWVAPAEPPEGVTIVDWDSGEALPPAEVLREVAYFVPPYMAPAADIAVAQSMPRLREVQALMAGIDGIAPLLPDGVVLHRAVGVHDTSTAELAVGLTIASLRGIDVAARDQPAGRWDHRRRPALADSRVAVVGWGGVGRAIGARLTPFEVTLAAFSRSGRDGSRPIADFDRELPLFDVVVLALPSQGTPFMDRTRLGAMRPGALLVNVGRGDLVDTDALVALAQAGRLRAALDVTDPEPLPPEHPLWRSPGVLVTPHLGGDSTAFVPRARALVAAGLARFAAAENLDEPLRNG